MNRLSQGIESKPSRRAWPALLHQVVRTIRSRGLVEPGQHLLVAVSGGPDSVALLSLLHRLRPSWSLTLTAVHHNYGLRGAESEADQEFVETLCRELKVPLQTRRLEVLARARRTSLQAEARDLRYRALTDLAGKCGADRIALGHTADDQAETVLLWMVRGAGMTGLSGMPACRDGQIIRPLYETRRRDILAYLHDAGLSFRRDSSNAKPLYLRNRIRHEILPVLQRVSPASVEALCRLADICREDDAYLDQQMAALCEDKIIPSRDGGWAIDRAFLQQVPHAVQRRVVRDLVRRCDSFRRSPSLGTVERILQVVTKRGVIADVNVKSIRVMVGEDRVRVIPSESLIVHRDRPHQVLPAILTVPGQVAWAETGQLIRAEVVPGGQGDATAIEKSRIVVDADRLSGPLLVRTWLPGDRFCPAGMKGRSKKLQDFFTDLKLPIAVRKRIPVVMAPEGIVWVVGYRQDERWTPTTATQRRMVIAVAAESTEEGT
ncbi:MAG: tRNA lysidine(34) synthetase TilS [Nitrospiraceae bacterium]